MLFPKTSPGQSRRSADTSSLPEEHSGYSGKDYSTHTPTAAPSPAPTHFIDDRKTSGGTNFGETNYERQFNFYTRKVVVAENDQTEASDRVSEQEKEPPIANLEELLSSEVRALTVNDLQTETLQPGNQANEPKKLKNAPEPNPPAKTMPKKTWYHFRSAWHFFCGIFIGRFQYYSTYRKHEFQKQFNHSIVTLSDTLKKHKLEDIDLDSWLSQLSEIANDYGEFGEKSLSILLANSNIKDQILRLANAPSRTGRQNLDSLSHLVLETQKEHQKILKFLLDAIKSNEPQNSIIQKRLTEGAFKNGLKSIIDNVSSEKEGHDSLDQCRSGIKSCSKLLPEIARPVEFDALVRDHLSSAIENREDARARIFDTIQNEKVISELKEGLTELEQHFVDVLKKVIANDETLKEAFLSKASRERAEALIESTASALEEATFSAPIPRDGPSADIKQKPQELHRPGSPAAEGLTQPVTTPATTSKKGVRKPIKHPNNLTSTLKTNPQVPTEIKQKGQGKDKKVDKGWFSY